MKKANILNNGLLSVIVRTTGDEINLLKKAVLSALTNSYPNIEIIVVCQTSEDHIYENVIAALRKLDASKYIHVFLNKTNCDERSRNLNIGLQHSKGEYIAFLDDDDYVAENHYSNLINAIVEEEVDMAYCIAQIVNAEGQLKADCFEGRYIDKLSFYKDNFITINSYVLKRSVVDDFSLGFNESLVLGEDYAFLFPVFFKMKTFLVHERTAFYRVVGNCSRSFTFHERRRKSEYKKIKQLKSKYKLSASEKVKIQLKRIAKYSYKVK